jgi:hypothetical protein
VTGTSDIDMINQSQPEKSSPSRDNSPRDRDVSVSAFGTYSAAGTPSNGAGINKTI